MVDSHRCRELQENPEAWRGSGHVLAIKLHVGLMVVDERRGRRHATAAGLTVMGPIGVVAQAKRAGLIGRAQP